MAIQPAVASNQGQNHPQPNHHHHHHHHQFLKVPGSTKQFSWMVELIACILGLFS
jgi:hypothetical protein